MICLTCKKEFYHRRRHAKYCCTTCKEAVKNRPYIKYRLQYCECCGFIPVSMCQLDVDHIDGNHKNNKEDNLQTLCANCHRLKTYLNADWQNKNK